MCFHPWALLVTVLLISLATSRTLNPSVCCTSFPETHSLHSMSCRETRALRGAGSRNPNHQLHTPASLTDPPPIRRAQIFASPHSRIQNSPHPCLTLRHAGKIAPLRPCPYPWFQITTFSSGRPTCPESKGVNDISNHQSGGRSGALGGTCGGVKTAAEPSTRFR